MKDANEAVRPRVLVVEDDEAILALLTAVLSAEYDIVTASTGTAALATALNESLDLILLDVGLPDANGLDICRRLKTHPTLVSVPVIFLTSRTSPDDEVDGFDAGGVDYITKPINPAVLRARVRNHLELKHARDALERIARMDAMTGIANRRAFDETLSREWRRLARVNQSLGVIMIDVDHFKQFNDTYGHGAGDSCLQRVAHAATAALQRPADFLARYGGEEFVALLPDTDLAGAVAVAEAIRTAVQDLKIPHSGSKVASCVTVSLGVACIVPKGDTGGEGLVEAADKQLYAAKSEGRNRVKSISLT